MIERRETVKMTTEPSGMRFGKYRLLRKIATGGMAEIFLASIEGPDDFSKTCVIKKILPEYAKLTDFTNMLVTEAKVAALLNHPNIVGVFDFGRIGENYFIAMEWVDGCSLESLIKQSAQVKQPLGPRVAVQVGIPLCEALDYAHNMTRPDGLALNLVHRDVTPGNVLISNSGLVKLTDFGVVKVSSNPNATQAGVVKGKFAYMSPEQVKSEPVDRRSDVFSTGIVLYELAVGRWLFRRPEMAAVVNAVANAEVPPPSSIINGFPQDLEMVLMRALAKDKNDRYATCREFLADLESFRSGRQWTSSTRELAALQRRIFPQGYKDQAQLTTNWDDPQRVPTDMGSHRTPITGGGVSGPLSGPYYEGNSHPGGSGSVTKSLLAVLLGAIGTVVFWWFALS